MYIPKHFLQEDRDEIMKFIQAHPFATLVSCGDSYPVATHIPVELETNLEGDKVFWGHVARANKQWRTFQEHPEVLVIFQGPNSYVSSSWYEEPEVPTWNYRAVHVYGQLKELSKEALRESLRRQIDRYEKASRSPVSMDTLPESIVEPQIKRIFGFEISIDKVEAKDKLSQNRSEKDYANIISELRNKDDVQSLDIAEAMNKRNKKE